MIKQKAKKHQIRKRIDKAKKKIRGYFYRHILFSKCKTFNPVATELNMSSHKKISTDFDYMDELCEPIRSFIHNPGYPGYEEANFPNKGVLENKGTIEEGIINIKTKCTESNWMLFKYQDDLPTEYEFSFDIKIESSFSEIQVAFKYKDLKNRLRFMLRDNKTAVFEMIYKGKFIKYIYKKPLQLQAGEYHNFRVVVHNNKYEWFIDQSKIFSVRQNWHLRLLGSGMCFIVYNKHDDRNIFCSIKDDCVIAK